MSEPTFRDRVATVDDTGGRVWIYPKKPTGKLYYYRQIVAYILLIFFLTSPFIEVGSQPLLMFNFLARKFVIFGQVFGPQDFHLFVIAMITFIVFIVLFTIIYGRVWCGWACPQTVFLEMVFRRIEYIIEGDGPAQRKKAGQPITFNGAARKLLKHGVFFALSLLIGHVFLAYLVGKERMWELIQDGPPGHMAGFTAMILFTLAFYGVFSWLREQACTLICPYGRLQGVLLDSNSIVVAYDYLRGEPRAKFKKTEDREQQGKGDCIDCGNCQAVCPTGIDIRNGTQLECVNCTACIDSCNKVMKTIHKPEGLIRLASENEIATGEKFRFTSRMIAYTVVLGILLVLFTSLVFLRGSLETTIIHVPGQLYQEMGTDSISNFYKITVVNKSNEAFSLDLNALSHPNAKIKRVGGEFLVEANESNNTVFFIVFNKNEVPGRAEKVTIGISKSGTIIQKKDVTFITKSKQK